MAKKRRRGTGSVISVKPLSGGLGKVGKPGSLLGATVPALVAGVAAGGGALLAEHMGKPSNGEVPSDTMIMLAENSPWVGVGAGAVASALMWALFGQSAGVTALAGTAAVGGTVLGYKVLTTTQSTATTDPATGPTVPATAGLGRYRYRMRGMRGVGAIVPQLQPPGMNGLGAIVMEPGATRGMRGLGDPRGETVSLGSVNPSAFGTPGFSF
jgi:hypothetical protein